MYTVSTDILIVGGGIVGLACGKNYQTVVWKQF